MNLSSANQSRKGLLRDLAALGQLRGALTVEEIREVLPIDRMSEEEVARTIAYLEEKGIEVVVDPKFLGGSAKAPREARFHQPAAELINTVSPATDGSNQLARSPPEQPLRRGYFGRSRAATAAVVLACTIVCVLAAILVWAVR